MLSGRLAWKKAGPFARLRTGAAACPPLPRRSVIAMRARAERVGGEAPPFAAAFFGGERTLRGYPHQRFAGHTALSGGAELRVPLTRVAVATPAAATPEFTRRSRTPGPERNSQALGAGVGRTTRGGGTG